MDQEGYWNIELDEQILQDLYAWIDQIPLSRPKRRIERDFSDGGLTFVLDLLLFNRICYHRWFSYFK